MTTENLLFHQVMKIIYENGTRYLIADEGEGFDRIRQVFLAYLEGEGVTLNNVTVANLRVLFRRSWDELLDDLVPFEARKRVTDEFKKLVF